MGKQLLSLATCVAMMLGFTATSQAAAPAPEKTNDLPHQARVLKFDDGPAVLKQAVLDAGLRRSPATVATQGDSARLKRTVRRLERSQRSSRKQPGTARAAASSGWKLVSRVGVASQLAYSWWHDMYGWHQLVGFQWEVYDSAPFPGCVIECGSPGQYFPAAHWYYDQNYEYWIGPFPGAIPQ